MIKLPRITKRILLNIAIMSVFMMAIITAVSVGTSQKAGATSPQACEINYIDQTIYCYQIVGPPAYTIYGAPHYVDYFHGSLHNIGSFCTNTIMVAVRGQWNLWSRIYVVRPGQFMYWNFEVWENLPPGVYTATFWDISWGTVFHISWRVL